jgi:uncharacterized protein
MNMRLRLLCLLSFIILFSVSRGQEKNSFINNPILNGYFADPTIVKFNGAYYIYATVDPWGGDELGVFETRDFKNFARKHINWPTKKACTSPTSGEAMVWAPSVVRKKNGKFYMYVSVGSEIWAGVSDGPLGPWKNAKEDNSPLINGKYFPGYHMIDAECFIDDDGEAYLYWGSGLNWVNGKCFVVKLKNDMIGFDGTPRDVTPPNYFEAPYMMKRNGVYYLMYSEGKAIDASYKIRYSIGKTPFGPWTEGLNSPILSTSADSSTYGPGHHTVFSAGGQDYILYHRIFPQKENFVLRQLCLDSLNFDSEGNIKKIIPTGIKSFSDFIPDSDKDKGSPAESTMSVPAKISKELNYYGVFKSVPANTVTPKGWLKQYLINQRNGLTGHLENAGYPFNTVGWTADSIPGNKSIEKWWPYEQNAYWVDGMERCGLLLNDSFLLNKARKNIYYVLAHPDSTGFLGPKFMKPNDEGDRWVYAVFFRALMAEYEATRNPEILEAIKKHYLGDRFPHTGVRESINAEIILWAYSESNDKALLDFAKEIYKNSNELNKNSMVSDIGFLKDGLVAEHGVTYLEKSKLGAILYLYTGDKIYLQPSIAAFKKLDKYHMLISGVNVSSEHIHPPTTQESHEICDISDYTWSISYLLKATGDAVYADKIERAAFNAAPGSVTKDFKALQYFSAPNQVIAARNSNVRDGGGSMRYAPNPATECCPGNVNRMMPNFAINSWMSDGKGGLAAAMYAPSSVECRLTGKNNSDLTIDENTKYPFSDSVNFIFHLKEESEFNFYVRIPGWCKDAHILINGTELKRIFVPATYISLQRKYKEGDKVTVILPSSFQLTPGPENGVSIERGPLVYSLKIDEDWRVDSNDNRSTPDFPAYELFAKSPWNYALCVTKEDLQKQIKVINKAFSDNPWSIENAPIELKVPARLVKGWTLQNKTEMKFENWDVKRNERGKVTDWYIAESTIKKGFWTFSPLLPDADLLNKGLSEQTDTITLVPYGCSKLRITVFPKGI